MSDKIKWGDIGNEVRSAITESLQTGDFTKLGSCLTDTVSGALDEFLGIQPLGSNNSGSGSSQKKAANSDSSESRSSSPGSSYACHVPKEETFTEKWIRENKAPKYELENSRPLQGVAVDPPFRRIGRISGVLLSVFGGIGIGLSLIMMMVFKLLMSVVGFGGFAIGVKAGGFLLLGSLIMTVIGGRKCKWLSKAKKYYGICRQKRYCNVDEIALRMNTSFKSALRDIKKLLRKGFFPQGHLSKDKSCFMLDDGIYSQYLEIDKQRRLEAQAAAEPVQPAPEASVPHESTGDSELDAMISEGKSCILRLRSMNDNIPGEEISDKLFRLEKLLKEIFERLKEHPEQKGQMHKFMDYYLPMTLKLVSAYEEFDSLSVQGEDIVEAKREIERTLDTINDAFGELLTRLFKDAAFDAATDAQVLQAMLAKEGLTGSGFGNK